MRRAVRGRDIKPGQVTLQPAGSAGPAMPREIRCARCRLAQRRTSSRSASGSCRRADYRDGPPWTLFRTRAALGAHRVVWPDLARRLEAAALTGAAVRQAHSDEYLLRAHRPATARTARSNGGAAQLRPGFVPSPRIRAPLAASGFRRFNARVIEDLPFPPGALEDTSLARAATSARSDDAVAAIDERVAHAPRTHASRSAMPSPRSSPHIVAEALRARHSTPGPPRCARAPWRRWHRSRARSPASLLPAEAAVTRPRGSGNHSTCHFRRAMHAIDAARWGAARASRSAAARPGWRSPWPGISMATPQRPVLAPAPLLTHWRRTALTLGVPVEVVSHARASRGSLPAGRRHGRSSTRATTSGTR